MVLLKTTFLCVLRMIFEFLSEPLFSFANPCVGPIKRNGNCPRVICLLISLFLFYLTGGWFQSRKLVKKLGVWQIRMWGLSDWPHLNTYSFLALLKADFLLFVCFTHFWIPLILPQLLHILILFKIGSHCFIHIEKILQIISSIFNGCLFWLYNGKSLCAFFSHLSWATLADHLNFIYNEISMFSCRKGDSSVAFYMVYVRHVVQWLVLLFKKPLF